MINDRLDQELFTAVTALGDLKGTLERELSKVSAEIKGGKADRKRIRALDDRSIAIDVMIMRTDDAINELQFIAQMVDNLQADLMKEE